MAITRNRFHYVDGKVAINITDTIPPEDSFDGGIEDWLPYVFKNEATTYVYEWVDERSVIHKEYNKGIILAKAPVFRIRLSVKWDCIEVGKLDSFGVGVGSIGIVSDYEMLVYLKKNFHQFSGNGAATLQLRLNTQVDIDDDVIGGWDSGRQETSYRVVPVSIEFSDIPNTSYLQYVGATLICEAYATAGLPYSIAPARPS